MRVLIAPDKFKSSLPAPAVAEAIAAGVRRVFPTASLTLRPLADGGEGTAAALLEVVGGQVERHVVSGPLGEPAEGEVVFLNNGDVVVESASASGLALLRDRALDARRASSKGTGELIRRGLRKMAASSDSIRSLIVAVGGTASTDAGTGAATAMGWRFLDQHGNDLSPGGGALVDLYRIEAPAVSESAHDVRIIAACDVDNPLTGPRGTAPVFARQKGASDADIEQLEGAMEKVADVIERDVGVDVRRVSGGGAGGGLGAGLFAFFDAEIQPGFGLVARTLRLEEALRNADVVITGEGRLDEQSLAGKTPIALGRLAQAAGIPCIAIAGDVALDAASLERNGIVAAGGVVQAVGRPKAFAEPARSIEQSVVTLLREVFQ